MKYYLLVDDQNIIRDAISYPADGYIEIEVSDSFPAGINGGWYKWENGTYSEISELKPIDETKARISNLEQLLADLTEVVLLGGGA